MTFLRGAASIMDIGGTMHQSIEDMPIQGDAEALKSDWEAIGADFPTLTVKELCELNSDKHGGGA